MAITRSQIAKQLLQQGGRAGFQEGGIMPRLNQLGSGVSSAEQTLQEINQRLQSAESSLGGGGGELPTGLTTSVQTPDPFFGRGELKPIQRPINADLPDKLIPALNTPLPGSIQNLQNQQDVVDLEQLYPNAGQNQISNFRPLRGGAEMMELAGIPAAGYADGGNVVGGEFDFESARQMYGLGKLVKKVTRTVKKIAKSPVGKLAIGAAVLGTPFGVSKKSLFSRGLGFLSSKASPFTKTVADFANDRLAFNAARTAAGQSSGLFDLVKKNPFGAISAVSAVAGLLTPEQEEEAQELARDEGIDIEAARQSILNPGTSQDFRALAFRAEGGPAEGKEPVAKKTMPLLDMGGQEMDLRAEGGFVPIGRMEKADDVPARLSKNEFVFTADAVRNAGDGNVDKGAEVMYNMMKNLESGGKVSEESQGLEGARKMFQTSQRLEEVL
jgi:hypothetical protein